MAQEHTKLIIDRLHFKRTGEVLADDEHFPFGIKAESIKVEPYAGGGALVTLTLFANEVVIDPPAPQEAPSAQELPVQDQGD